MTGKDAIQIAAQMFFMRPAWWRPDHSEAATGLEWDDYDPLTCARPGKVEMDRYGAKFFFFFFWFNTQRGIGPARRSGS